MRLAAAIGRRPRQALTLVEVICTLAIFALVMAALAGLVQSTVRSSEAASARVRGERIRYGIARILQGDLANAICLPEPGGFALVARQPDAESGGSVLEFTTTRPLAGTGPSGSPRRIEYVVRTSPGDGESYELVRRERTMRLSATGAAEDTVEETLARGISIFRIECYDGTEWQRQWARLRLPAALRIDLALATEGATTQSVETLYFAPAVNPDLDPVPSLAP